MIISRFIAKSWHYLHRRLLFITHKLMGDKSIDEHLVLFYSDVDYSDSSRVLYEYLLANKPEYRFVWLMSKAFPKMERPRTEFVRLFGSLHSFILLSSSKYIFHTHPIGNLFKPRKGQIVVNLWHGIPFKGIKGYVINKEPPFNIILCLGDNSVETTARFVGCDKSYVRPWGYPRIDLLCSAKENGCNNPFAPSGFSGKLIIWMPTFRKSVSSHLSEINCDNETGLPLLSNVEKIEEFNEFLKSTDLIVIAKIHHLQASKDIFEKKYSNLIFLQDKEILAKGYQLYEVVAKSDALLTDYSSISADYMVMNRPIGFILDDLEEYKRSRGAFMYEPITEVLGGSHIYNYEELKQFCYEIAKGIDSTSEFRNNVKRMMLKYPDGNNCKRLVEYLSM